jgi:hypothetical protein
VRGGTEKNRAHQPVNGKPALVLHAAVVGKSGEQQKEIESKNVDRAGRLGPERDEQVADGGAALVRCNGQENHVDDHQDDRGWTQDSVQMHRPVETAEGRLQSMGADDREQRHGHQRDGPQHGDLRKRAPGPKIVRLYTLESRNRPENGRDDQRTGSHNPTRPPYLKAGNPTGQCVAKFHVFMPILFD